MNTSIKMDDTTILQTLMNVETMLKCISTKVKHNHHNEQDNIGKDIYNIKSNICLVKKYVTRQLKNNLKIFKKKMERAENRKNCGFQRKIDVSTEMLLFLGEEIGTQVSRTMVTNRIHCYIKKNNLQNKINGQKIDFDEKLGILLHLDENTILTYFNLQRYLKFHFPKTI